MSVRIQDGTGAPDHFDQGLPYMAAAVEGDLALLAVDTVSAIDHHHQGLPFTAASRLATVVDAVVDYYGSGAAPFDAANRLVTTGSPAASWIAGVTFNSGKVATT